jgi:hypothetical protein
VTTTKRAGRTKPAPKPAATTDPKPTTDTTEATPEQDTTEATPEQDTTEATPEPTPDPARAFRAAWAVAVRSTGDDAEPAEAAAVDALRSLPKRERSAAVASEQSATLALALPSDGTAPDVALATRASVLGSALLASASAPAKPAGPDPSAVIAARIGALGALATLVLRDGPSSDAPALAAALDTLPTPVVDALHALDGAVRFHGSALRDRIDPGSADASPIDPDTEPIRYATALLGASWSVGFGGRTPDPSTTKRTRSGAAGGGSRKRPDDALDALADGTVLAYRYRGATRNATVRFVTDGAGRERAVLAVDGTDHATPTAAAKRVQLDAREANPKPADATAGAPSVDGWTAWRIAGADGEPTARTLAAHYAAVTASAADADASAEA